jgi:UDP:flavonoid glycosyltransferase YjiC (YdhE family)
MYFLFSLHGTKGDILPFLQIAKTIQKAGVGIQFVVNEYFFDYRMCTAVTNQAIGSSVIYR